MDSTALGVVIAIEQAAKRRGKEIKRVTYCDSRL